MIIPMIDTPYDYTTAAATVETVLGGLGAGLILVLGAALAVKAVRWGIPKIVGFFTRNV